MLSVCNKFTKSVKAYHYVSIDIQIKIEYNERELEAGHDGQNIMNVYVYLPQVTGSL